MKKIYVMLVFLWILEILVGILLVLAVLMQVGRGESISTMFGGGAQSIFGPKGPTTILEKITLGLIAAFFIITIGISKLSTTRTITTPEPMAPPEIPSPENLIPKGNEGSQKMPSPSTITQ